MLLSTVLFALMVLAIRLASEQVHAFEVAFFRSLFGMLAALPLLRLHGIGLLRTTQLPRYMLRCVLGTLAMLCGFWAIANLPLAHAVSLSYSSPLFVTIAAALWLGEQVRARRWSAVVAGFIGVLVIVRKQLTRIEPADRIVIWTTILWVPMSLPAALAVWEWPVGITWLWLGAAGVLGTAGHMFWTRALNLGDVSALSPISFLQLPIVALLGWLLFAEALDAWTITGAAIILAANGYIAHREATIARRKRRPVTGATPAANKPPE